MLYKDNDLLRQNGVIYRVLASSGDGTILIINCTHIGAPRYVREDDLNGAASVSEQEMRTQTNRVIPEHLDQRQEQECNRRYARVSPALMYLTDCRKRYSVLAETAEVLHLSRRRLKDDFNLYLAYQTKAVFAPPLRAKPELSNDQKNMRWAINKYYYTRYGKSISGTYVMMLKERYCDTTGNLLPHHPSIHQFRYFFRQTRKFQTEYITREGIKAYEMNHRPLLGASVQQYAPFVGVGMLDSTVCDIYLCDDAGNVVGRPLFTVCVDAHTSMCTAYSLTWEGGMYSVRNMLLNSVTNKVDVCNQLGIDLCMSDWDCDTLMGTYVTDKGTEYTSSNFEQLTELGISIVNLPAFRADQKGPVEKLFNLVQEAYKSHLKGYGTIEPDFQRRGGHDYRRDAVLTLHDFEKIVVRTIIYYNTQRVLCSYPYTRDMLVKQIAPHAAALWNYGKTLRADGLISISKACLMLVLLPRTKGRFARNGLVVNGLRYHCEGFTEQYLRGEETVVAYNPDNTSSVYLVKYAYREFKLIDARYSDMTIEDKNRFIKDVRDFVKSYQQDAIQGQIDLANHIETIVANTGRNKAGNIQDIRTTRLVVRTNLHKNLLKEATNG